jgi:hypothetical protein
LFARVATAGDVNGDGYSDVVVGAQNYDLVPVDTGRALVYHGSAGGLARWPAWAGGLFQAGALFGSCVASAGDVNGDGFSDVIVGAPLFEQQPTYDEGWAFLYLGSPAGLRMSHAWYTPGGQVGAQFGVAVAGAGDVNGDGFSDVIVGAPLYDNGETDEGRVFLYFGNAGDGLDRVPRQARADDTAPIYVLGLSDSESSFRVKALGRTPAGRGGVKLQWEVKPLGVPFDGTGLGTTALLDTGAPVPGVGSAVAFNELVASLSPNTAYRWRLRTVTDSPFFPRSPWFGLPYNGPGETDLRTRPTVAPAEPTAPGAALALRLLPGRPNPFATQTTLPYAMPAPGRARLAVYDAQGREVALLVDKVENPGTHAASWDGRDARGTPLASGVYFARLEAGGEVSSLKLVLAR